MKCSVQSRSWNGLTSKKAKYNITVYYLAKRFLFEVNNRNTRKRWEICSKLAIKTPKRRQWRRVGVFIVYFEHITHFFSSVSIVDLTSRYQLGNILDLRRRRYAKEFCCKSRGESCQTSNMERFAKIIKLLTILGKRSIL